MLDKRSVFSLNGITGMLIATLLLITILVCLTIWNVITQREQIKKPYKLENIEQVRMIETRPQTEFRVDAAKDAKKEAVNESK